MRMVRMYLQACTHPWLLELLVDGSINPCTHAPAACEKSSACSGATAKASERCDAEGAFLGVGEGVEAKARVWLRVEPAAVHACACVRACMQACTPKRARTS